MRPLVHQHKVCRTEEHNEGELRQVDLVDLLEDLLPHARIRRRLFLGKQPGYPLCRFLVAPPVQVLDQQAQDHFHRR